jgi:hypothetical protein
MDEIEEELQRVLQDEYLFDKVEIRITKPSALENQHATVGLYATAILDNELHKHFFLKMLPVKEMTKKNVQDNSLMEKEADFFNNFFPYAKIYLSNKR